MAKTYRDRINFYRKNLTWANDPIFCFTKDALRQEVKIKNGGKVFSMASLPKEIKDELTPNRYMWKTNTYRSSQNQRKQIASLKKRYSRIERTRNNRIIDKEIKLFIEETNADIKELNDFFA
jgi:hypothetical protein